jgi:hypothetical protein
MSEEMKGSVEVEKWGSGEVEKMKKKLLVTS